MPEFILHCLMDKWLVQFKHPDLAWTWQQQTVFYISCDWLGVAHFSMLLEFDLPPFLKKNFQVMHSYDGCIGSN